MISARIGVRLTDRGCRYWSKIYPLGDPLPMPQDVSDAFDVPDSSNKRFNTDLYAGNILIEGE